MHSPARIGFCLAFAIALPGGQATDSTRRLFDAHCAGCHGGDGAGGEHGPAIAGPGRFQKDVRTVIRAGIPDGGMPAFSLPQAEVDALAEFVSLLRRPGGEGGAPRLENGRYSVVWLQLKDGAKVRGAVRNESNYDIQIEDSEGYLRSFTKDQIASETRESAGLIRSSKRGLSSPAFSEIAQPAAGDWPTYNGHLGGNRHSSLTQLNRANAAQLTVKWMFPVPESHRLEVTPLVVQGVMYLTGANAAYALDAQTGRQIWRYSRPLTQGLVGDAAGAINRGAALLGGRLFMVTDNAHLIALDRFDGQLLWDVEMADYRAHYGATSAPLVVNDLVLSGTSGGDEGARGFIDAYRASSGQRVWRLWTMPARGEPLSETWAGTAIDHGCAAAWLTGVFDTATKLVYWPTGNPCPDYNGDERRGDNLYSSSVLAIEPETGKLRWHYQFTPHDVHDWDAVQTPLVVDADFHGQRRQLLMQANRNGFFYVIDRVNGHVLLARPFVKRLSWATGIGADGRPQLIPGQEPAAEGVKTCPSVVGATNWMSPAYNPSTGLFYVMALESCGIYTKFAENWERGKSFYGGTTRKIEGQKGQKVLRAIDIQTGGIVWEYPQIGPGQTWGGLLSTAGGLIFFCDDSGAFAALDARTGKPLWHFNASQSWHASPMTYAVDGKQYVAVAAGSEILVFGLP